MTDFGEGSEVFDLLLYLFGVDIGFVYGIALKQGKSWGRFV